MDIVVIADLHLHHLPTWRLEWCEEFVSEMLNEDGAFVENTRLPIGTPLCLLGDALEVRDKVDSRVLNLFLKLVTGWRGEVIWVAGQHDSLRPGYATLHELKHVENVTVVDSKPHWALGAVFVPFMRELEDYRAALKQVEDDSVVFTHMPTEEILRHYGAQDPVAVSMAEFDRFRYTFSGDIHVSYDSPKHKFSYIGAPSQRDWRDKGVTGCIGVADTETGGLRRWSFPHPIHLEVADESEIPDDEFQKYIVRLPSGKTTSKPNVLQATQKAALDMSSVQLRKKVDQADVIAEYVKANPAAQGNIENKELTDYAAEVLKRCS